MPFFSKSISSPSPSSASASASGCASASASSPASPSSSSSSVRRRLVRLRKLRHATDEELGLNRLVCASAPDSPDPGGKQRSPFGVPQPLPRPDCCKRSEGCGSNPVQDHHGSPEEKPISALRRASTDNIPTKSGKSLSNFRERFSQYANVESSNNDFRLRIPIRSAPTSGLSSPSASPRRSGAGDVAGDPFLSCFVAERAKSPSNCHREISHDINVECSNYHLRTIGAPCSAPTSVFPSPAVSPQRASTVDFSNYFMAPQEFHHQSALEVPDLRRFEDQMGKVVLTPNHTPLLCQAPRSPGSNTKTHDKFSFPGRQKLIHGNSKEWPECNGHVSAHPLPRPPGAGPSQSYPLSPPPAIHHTPERPNLSPKKGQWLKGKLIGRGTYGRVYYGTHRETGASCAMKEVDIILDDPKSVECIKQLEQEIRVLRQLEHPNIVQYYGSETVDDHFYIYLELVHPGPINKYVHEHCGRITESIVRNFTRHILSGLAYLHSTKTIHRDIKGANLLVNASGTVKLADFGTAKHLTGLSYELSLKGSPHWMAPEVIKAVMQKDANPNLALAVDIWSLGCTIIEMFTGKPPWGDLQGAQAMFKVLNKGPPIPETLSPEGKEFLSLCLQRNPADRPTALKLLEHPFVRNSSDVKVPPCKQASSVMNLAEKMPSPKDGASHKIDSVPSSPCTRIANGKLHTNREITQQNHVPFFNCSTAYHPPYSTHEVHHSLPAPQSVHASQNCSSSRNLSPHARFGSVNNHLVRSHGREVPHI